ncbi:hypothetical protein [Blastopirellula marina]|uniref:Uncharacterized protein n=1 Tax=Blastopirellula marina TaxID=124 RepID=A0A2S8FDH2_9BACT|nr:hypothetical protein [Blastopirellula marina]PQO29974.1 hypothetical protein C5Y98_22190 [Blastopirellula marina]PTL42442.1 hypothetical protein C5Y97_22200 [Blastopirellula marina]
MIRRYLVGLLVLLSLGPLRAEEPGSGTIVPDPFASAILEKVAKLDKLLREKQITLDLDEVPLGKFAQVLSDELNVPVDIDELSLRDLAFSIEMPISVHVKEVSVKSMLDIVLPINELALLVYPDGIVISTQDEADAKLLRRHYDVADLIDGNIARAEYLCRVLVDSIRPVTWEHLGGPGSIAVWETKLVIMNTWEVHQQVNDFLAALRVAKNLPSESYSVKPLACSPWQETHEQLEQKLDTVQVSIDLLNKPLDAVTQTLSKLCGCNVLIDLRALEENGFSPDMPIKLPQRSRSLRHTLDLICQDLELDWDIKSEVLRITTPEETESDLHVCVYPIRDLMWKGPKSDDPVIQQRLLKLSRWQTTPPYQAQELQPLCLNDYPALPGGHQLKNVILTSIEPDMWEELEGPGTCYVYPLADCLVITQSRRVHQQVRVLLQELREHPPWYPVSAQLKQADQAEAEVITVSYRVPTEIDRDPSVGKRKPVFSPQQMTEIATFLTQTIEPDSWHQSGHYATYLQDKLIVRNRRDVLFQVHDRLVELGVSVPIDPGLYEAGAPPEAFFSGMPPNY